MIEDVQLLRTLCLALPEVFERSNHGDPSWLIRRRTIGQGFLWSRHARDTHVGLRNQRKLGMAAGLVVSDVPGLGASPQSLPNT